MNVVTMPTDGMKRMAQLRDSVRNGKGVEEAAREMGVDPLIALLWLRLPDDLWPSEAAASPAATPSHTGAPFALPRNGLRRVLTCRIPLPALDRLRSSGKPFLEAAASALHTGLSLSLPEVAGSKRCSIRPLAVPICADDYRQVSALAGDHFNGDCRRAAGWAIARGVGMNLPLPTEEEMAVRFVFVERTPEPYIPPPVVDPRPRRGSEAARKN